ncbi:MAG: aspartate aminotransferase family protein [Elusimicrobia bacterium]|nr:aspartate aminotransferase family protein [Elusimicrobiota bacterium]
MKETELMEPAATGPWPSPDETAKLRERYILPLPGPMYSKPLQIVKGRMQYVFDETGRRYLDAFAGVATVSIGHSHPHFVRKLSEQIGEYLHNPALYLHPSLPRYAERLIAKLKTANPALEACFFTNSGSEANELAALIAKNFTGSHEFVAMRHSYHGRTLMAMALTGQANWRHSMPYVYGVSFAPANYVYRKPDSMDARQFTQWCVGELEDAINASTSGKIAGFYAEPINGVGGVITPEPEYFPGAYEAIKRHGGLFIADEVQTGLGRTGRKFLGIEQWGVKPDIVTMAKGLGNGYPIGAVVTTREIAAAVKGKLHYNTFGGSPAQMAAASAVLDVFDSENLSENAHQVGGYLLGALGKLAERSGCIGEVRGKGLMIGLELVKDKKSKEPAPELALKILDACKERGVLIGKGGMAGNVLRVKPPLCITRQDADAVVAALSESIAGL